MHVLWWILQAPQSAPERVFHWLLTWQGYVEILVLILQKCCSDKLSASPQRVSQWVAQRKILSDPPRPAATDHYSPDGFPTGPPSEIPASIALPRYYPSAS